MGPCKAIETSRSVCPHAPAARGASQDRRDRVIPDGRRGEATNDYYIGKGKTFLLGCFAPTICKMLSLHGLLITRCPCGTMQGDRDLSRGLPARACGAGVLRKTGANGYFPMVVGAKQPFINVLGKAKHFCSVASPLPYA